MSALTHTCPRCAGFPRAFAHHGHINQGRCLLCHGELQVTKAQAAAFIAAQLRSVPMDIEEQAPPARPSSLRGMKKTTVGGVAVEIRRFVTEEGEHFTLSTDSEVGTLVSSFELVNGRVMNPRLCNGHHTLFGGKAGFVLALQAAYAAKKAA